MGTPGIPELLVMFLIIGLPALLIAAGVVGVIMMIKSGKSKSNLAICPKCHNRIPVDAQACPKCGQAFKEQKEIAN